MLLGCYSVLATQLKDLARLNPAYQLAGRPKHKTLLNYVYHCYERHWAIRHFNWTPLAALTSSWVYWQSLQDLRGQASLNSDQKLDILLRWQWTSFNGANLSNKYPETQNCKLIWVTQRHIASASTKNTTPTHAPLKVRYTNRSAAYMVISNMPEIYAYCECRPVAFDLGSLQSVFTRFRNKLEKSWPEIVATRTSPLGRASVQPQFTFYIHWIAPNEPRDKLDQDVR